MFRILTLACLSLAGIGWNPQLLKQAVAPSAQRWTVADLEDSVALSWDGLSVIFRGATMLVTDGTESMTLDVQQEQDSLTLTVLDGEQAGQVLQVTRDGDSVSMSTPESFSLAANTWTDDGGEVHIQVVEELGFLGGLLLGAGLAAGLLLVICLGLGTFCINALQGNLPRRVVYHPFICPLGIECTE